MSNGIFQSDLAAVIPPQIIKPESWLSKIEFINHLILFNNAVITVLSEKSGGKTSFASMLPEHLDPQIKLLSITAQVPCHREHIINEIATQFHLPINGNTDISSLVTQINERRSHVLLMIDNAQHVPETFIKEVMLAIKNQEGFSFFHLCLFSDYSVVAALNSLSSSFFQDLVHTIELGPLNENETRTYVMQRANASRLASQSLSEAQVKQLYQKTQGNIAKINKSLEAFLLSSNAFKKPANKMDQVKKIGIPVGTALLSGVACLLLTKAFYQEPSASSVVASQNTELKQLPKVLMSQIASWQDASTRELVEHRLAAKQNLDRAGDAIAIAGKAVYHAKKKASPRLLARSHPKRQRVKIYKKTKVAQRAANMEKRYTIQLVASPDKVDMIRYRKNNKLLYDAAKLSHYREKDRAIWYVLTIGEYSNMSEAQESIKRLPPSLLKLNPWVRNISTLG